MWAGGRPCQKGDCRRQHSRSMARSSIQDTSADPTFKEVRHPAVAAASSFMTVSVATMFAPQMRDTVEYEPFITV